MRKHKIFIVLFCIFFIAIPVKADLTPKQEKNLVSFVTGFIETGLSKVDSNGYSLLAYSQLGRNNGYFNKLYYLKKDYANYNTIKNNKWVFDCSSFASFVYKHLFDLYLTKTKTKVKDPYSGLYLLSQKENVNPWTVDYFVSDADKNLHFYYVFQNSKGKGLSVNVETIDYNRMKPGDLIIIKGKHIMIYIGDGIFAHASGSEINKERKDLGFAFNKLEYKYVNEKFYVIRIKDNIIDPQKEGNTSIRWIDDGSISDFDDNYTALNVVLERERWHTMQTMFIRATNNIGIVGYSINSSDFINVSITKNLNIKYDINHNGIYNVAVKDINGNITRKSVVVTNIDLSPPEIISINKSSISKKGCYYTITASDNESGIGSFAYSYDDGITWTSNKKVYVKSGDTYSVIVSDNAGNNTSYRDGMIDLDVTLSTTNWTNKNSLIISAKSKNSILGYSINSSEYTNIPATNDFNIKYNITKNGTYTISIKDVNNNVVKKTINVTKIDNTLPVINKVTKSSISSKGCYFTISASDANSKLPKNPYSYDGGITWTSNKKVYIKVGNIYKIWIRDNAGNIKKYYYDYTVLNITSNTTKWTKEVNLLISATNKNGIRDYTINNNSYTNNDMPLNINYKINKNGTYNIKVSDIYGNVTTKSINIKNIDNTSPIIKKIQKSSITSKGCYYSVTAVDYDSKLPSKAYSYDNGVTWTSNRKIYVKSGDKYTITVRDNANNISYYSL